MSQPDQDFTIFAGRDSAPVFTVVDADGNAVDLSQVQDIGWDCQQDLSSAAALQKLKSAGGISFVTDGTDGKFRVTLTATDTSQLSGFYMHEAWVEDSTGLQTEVATGRLHVGRAPPWSYSGDPSLSQKDALRFTIGDTNYKDQQLSDGEILFALSQTQNLNAAAAICCRSIASKYSREVDSVQMELRTLYSARATAYSNRAKEFDVLAAKNSFGVPYAGGISRSDKRLQQENTDRVRPQFNLGMDDNYLPVGPAYNERMLWGRL